MVLKGSSSRLEWEKYTPEQNLIHMPQCRCVVNLISIGWSPLHSHSISTLLDPFNATESSYFSFNITISLHTQ